jgi:Glyoxalase-like domain
MPNTSDPTRRKFSRKLLLPEIPIMGLINDRLSALEAQKRMLHSEIDHLVITAPSLDEGAEYVRRKLGVMPEVGGEHQRMGTHNRLVKLGDKTYLEVIAANPSAPTPSRPRWYELDASETHPAPRLTTWVARINDIDTALAVSPVPLGGIESMSRGQLDWRITIPSDGSLPLQGIAPTLIQWANGYHPASGLNDLGCSLIRLDGFHPEADKITALLKAIGFEGGYNFTSLPTHDQPFLVAIIQTSRGVRQLGARE